MLWTILGLFLLVVVFLLLLKLIKNVFKAIMYFSLLIFIVVGTLGVITILDMKDLKQTFEEKTTTYLLSEDGVIIAGFAATTFHFINITPLSNELARSVLDNEDDYGIIFNIDHELFKNQSIKVNGEELIWADVYSKIKSSNYEDGARLYSIALSTLLVKETPIYLFMHVRDELVKIKPNGMIIKFITMTPKSIMNGMREKSLETIEKARKEVEV